MKFIFLSFFENNLASRSSTFTCNLTSDIKLPAHLNTSCWRAKSILISVRDGFMNFIQIERFKANADARSQLCHFVF